VNLAALFERIFRTPIEIAEFILPFTFLRLLLEFVLPIVVAAVLWRLLRAGVIRALGRSSMKKEASRKVIRWFRLGFRLLFAAFLVVLIARLLGAEMFSYINAAINFLNQPFYESGSTRISIITLMLLVPVLYAASWSGKWAKHTVDSSFLERLSIDPSKRFSISSLTRYAVMAIVFLIGLSLIGINLSSLAVLFGVLGIGVGFGLQSTVANFFAGLVIIFSRPIKEGDRILVNNFEGTVRSIRILSSVINTITEETIIIPNSHIVTNTVHNYSYEDIRIILHNDVQVSYGSDLDKVERVLTEVGERSPYREPGKPVKVLVKSFDDSGITVGLVVWIRTAFDRIPAHSWANMEIWRAFRDNGVEIPFPQVDLHVRDSVDIPLKATRSAVSANAAVLKRLGGPKRRVRPPGDR
jgi:small-conductance mechanosensitive channel